MQGFPNHVIRPDGPPNGLTPGRTADPVGLAQAQRGIARLPAPARARMQDWLDQDRNLLAGLAACDAEIEQGRALLHPLRSKLDEYHAEASRELRPGPWTEAAARQQREYDAAVAEIALVVARRTKLQEQRSTLPTGRLLSWLGQLPPDVRISMHSGPAPRLKKGQVAADAIAECRERILELRADLRMVRSAPLPSGMVKAKIREQIAALAYRSAPDVLPMIEGGAAGVEWPVAHLMPNFMGAVGDKRVFVGGEVKAPDALGLIAYLFRDELIARLEREVDELADDKTALAPDARKRREAELIDEILAAERAECAWLAAAAAEAGTPVIYCDDTDPRAILDIVIERGAKLEPLQAARQHQAETADDEEPPTLLEQVSAFARRINGRPPRSLAEDGARDVTPPRPEPPE